MIHINYKLCVLDSEIEIHDYSSSSSTYKNLVSGYPKLLSEEIAVSPVPSSVNAADLIGNTMYLLQGHITYSYTLSGTSPNLDYTFLNEFDMSVNDLRNPFSALAGSRLPIPPTGITAMVSLSDGSVTLAFQQMKLYMFEKSTGHWEYKGTVTTPCDLD